MSKNINVTIHRADRVDDLATAVRGALDDTQRPLLNEDEQSYSYVMVSGPPLPPSEYSALEELCGECPEATTIVGCSSHGIGSSDFNGRLDTTSQWAAFVVQSRFIMPHVAMVAFDGASPADGTRLSNRISACAEQLVLGLPEAVRASYFLGKDEPRRRGAIRPAPFDIEYRRPAYVLVQLPGMGANWNEHKNQWPMQNVDFRFVEELTDRAVSGLPIFGGSATTNWPPPNDRPDSWVLARGPKGLCIGSNLVVVLLVETDLVFSFGVDHGFEPSPDSPILLQKGNESWQVSPRDGYAQPRYHVFQRVGDLDREDVQMIEDPAVEGASLVPLELVDDETVWTTLDAHEADQFLPNPPYDKGDQGVGFLRPVGQMTKLAMAKATRPSLLRAVDTCALSAEQSLGPEMDTRPLPTAAFVVSCRGRHHLLGASAIDCELRRISGTIQGIDTLLVYCDGETCPTPEGVSIHRNWTIAVLLLGNGYCMGYEDACQRRMLRLMSDPRREVWLRWLESYRPVTQNTVDRHGLSGADDVDGFLRALRRIIRARLRTREWTLRIYWPPTNSLRFVEAVCYPNDDDHHIYLDDNSRHQGRREYDVARFALGRANEMDGSEVIVIPIQLNERLLGTLTVSPDTAFPGEHQRVLTEIVEVATFPLDMTQRAHELKREVREQERLRREQERLREEQERLREELTTTIKELLEANTLQEAAQCVVKGVQRMVSECVYVQLMYANLVENPERLDCIACVKPESSKVQPSTFHIPDLRTGEATALGLTGWLFTQAHNRSGMHYETEWFADDIATDIPTGARFRSCISEVSIASNYLVLLEAQVTRIEIDSIGINRIDPGGRRPIGVLVVESEAGILSASHQQILRDLADVCGRHLVNFARVSRLKRYLSMLLRPGVVEWASHVWSEEIYERWPFGRRIVTILFADVRGYTAMSEIVGERRMAGFLEKYYATLVECIKKHGGAVDKLMGDGVMALFGDDDVDESVDNEATPEEKRQRLEDRCRSAAEDAVRAGLAIAKRFDKLREEFLGAWRYERTEIGLHHRFNIGVVVHTGKPVVGFFNSAGKESRTGDDHDGHLTYTAVGRDVNIAARLCGHVDHNKVFVTGATNWYLRKSAAFEIDQRHPTVIPHEEIKGIAHNLEVFEVRGIVPKSLGPE